MSTVRDVHNIRTTTVGLQDVTMMYCKERYMKNLPTILAYSYDIPATWKLKERKWEATLITKNLLVYFQVDCLTRPKNNIKCLRVQMPSKPHFDHRLKHKERYNHISRCCFSHFSVHHTYRKTTF